MSNPKDSDPSSAIIDAIRAKRERKSAIAEDIAAIEASLLADIETFDLDAAEQRARNEQQTSTGAGLADPSLVFPTIAPTKTTTSPEPDGSGEAEESTQLFDPRGSLLSQLRQQAELRQREQHSARAERTAINSAIDRALKRLFFFLHDFVQQLNILKPAIPRAYPLADEQVLGALAWQEGFADYRTQSQAAGALVELVSCTYRLAGGESLHIQRDGPVVERFRSLLFDYGLRFNCKESKNERRYTERADFEIQPEISVNARWRADFDRGLIILDARNLERLGSISYAIRPQALDQAMLDDFGRLILGLPNRFREQVTRQ